MLVKEAFLTEEILANESNSNHTFMATVPIEHNFIYKKLVNPTLGKRQTRLFVFQHPRFSLLLICCFVFVTHRVVLLLRDHQVLAQAIVRALGLSERYSHLVRDDVLQQEAYSLALCSIFGHFASEL